MEFKDGRIQGFELKFKSLDQDTERYLFALVDLLDAGKIEQVPGQSLHQSHYDEGYAWIMESYFEKGLFDQIEDYFTPSGETFFGPFHDSQLKYMDRLISAGEDARVKRIWRAHIGLMKAHFWFFVGERDKNLNAGGGDTQSLAARARDLKTTMLSVMADYRAVLVEIGSSDSELAQVDGDIAAIEKEERPKPMGKKDNRSMNEEVFWELIGDAHNDATLVERLEVLPERLALFKPSAIRKFDLILREKDNEAYRSDVWALAYLLQGGCSDDSFDAFRGWLILQGREVFEGTLASPDQFDVTCHHGHSGGMDSLRDAAPAAYELREGKPMKPVKGPRLGLTGPDIDEEDFADYLPTIAAALKAAE